MSQQLADMFANAVSKVIQSGLKLQIASVRSKRLKGSKVEIKTVSFLFSSLDSKLMVG